MKRNLRLRRPVKLARNAVLAAVIMVAAWACLGFPSPTARGAFRRGEQAYLTGPGQILAEVPLAQGGQKEKLFVARYQGHMLLATVWREGLLRWQPGGLTDHPIQGELTAFPGVWADKEAGLLHVFVQAPAGTRRVEGVIDYAQFSFAVKDDGTLEYERVTAPFAGEQTTEGGLFSLLAQFDPEGPAFYSLESQLDRLGQVRLPRRKSNPDFWMTITLRAYDAQGNVLAENTHQSF